MTGRNGRGRYDRTGCVFNDATNLTGVGLAKQWNCPKHEKADRQNELPDCQHSAQFYTGATSSALPRLARRELLPSARPHWIGIPIVWQRWSGGIGNELPHGTILKVFHEDPHPTSKR
jgi:hypothetical protein